MNTIRLIVHTDRKREGQAFVQVGDEGARTRVVILGARRAGLPRMFEMWAMTDRG